MIKNRWRLRRGEELDSLDLREVIMSWHYRASMTERVTSVTVQVSSSIGFFGEEEEERLLLTQKPGRLGWSISVVSLVSIRTTDDITGLSSAHSCTHKRPICMHLKTSCGRNVDDDASTITGSTISSPFPSFQFLHTCSCPKRISERLSIKKNSISFFQTYIV